MAEMNKTYEEPPWAAKQADRIFWTVIVFELLRTAGCVSKFFI